MQTVYFLRTFLPANKTYRQDVKTQKGKMHKFLHIKLSIKNSVVWVNSDKNLNI
jgi:hypothetical protein